MDFEAPPVEEGEFFGDGQRRDGRGGGCAGEAVEGGEDAAGGVGVGLVPELVELDGGEGPLSILGGGAVVVVFDHGEGRRCLFGCSENFTEFDRG